MSQARHISCASGGDAFSSIRVDRVKGLIRLVCPKEPELTPDAARLLADILLDLAYRIDHHGFVNPDTTLEA